MLEKKPAMTPEAPWSDRAKKKTPLRDRKSSVVYVLARTDTVRSKIGRTTQLRARLAQLRQDERTDLHIAFWVELPRLVACDVERTALQGVRKKLGIDKRGEWFEIAPRVAAHYVVSAMRDSGVNPICQAGHPGSFEFHETQSEIEKMFGEKDWTLDRKGRLPRGHWI